MSKVDEAIQKLAQKQHEQDVQYEDPTAVLRPKMNPEQVPREVIAAVTVLYHRHYNALEFARQNMLIEAQVAETLRRTRSETQPKDFEPELAQLADSSQPNDELLTEIDRQDVEQLADNASEHDTV